MALYGEDGFVWKQEDMHNSNRVGPRESLLSSFVAKMSDWTTTTPNVRHSNYDTIKYYLYDMRA